MTTKTMAQDLVQKWTDAWNSHDAARVAASYAADARVVDPAYPEPLSGRGAIEKDAADFFIAFPDMSFRLRKVVSDGDSICVEGSAAGTHRGPLPLPSGLVPATNRRLEFDVGIFLTVDATGSVTSERRYYDIAGQLAQLGLMQ